VPLRYIMQRLGVNKDPEEVVQEAREAREALRARHSNGSSGGGVSATPSFTASSRGGGGGGNNWVGSIVVDSPAKDPKLPHMMCLDQVAGQASRGCRLPS
jgi:hypothetical protein